MTSLETEATLPPSRVLALMRSRRVCHAFTDQAVERKSIETIVEAGRWATSASNARLHRFLVVRDQARIALVKAVSPGMWTAPPAIIVICTDLDAARDAGVQLGADHTQWMDVGTAVMNMMLAAHSLGLGSCPASSFSRSGLKVVLDLPAKATPELILQLGHPAQRRPGSASGKRRPITAQDLTFWERYPVGKQPQRAAASAR